MTVYQRISNITRVSARVMAVGLVLTLGGCGIFGGDSSAKKIEAAEEVYQIGVNAYLWRATLDTISFMPSWPPIRTAALSWRIGRPIPAMSMNGPRLIFSLWDASYRLIPWKFRYIVSLKLKTAGRIHPHVRGPLWRSPMPSWCRPACSGGTMRP